MTIGPAQDVLKELKARVFGAESGAVFFAWDSAHGRRVARIEEADEPASGEAVVTGDEPVDYVQVGGIVPTPSDKPTPKPEGSWEERAGKAVGRSFIDAWRTVWPPKNERPR